MRLGDPRPWRDGAAPGTRRAAVDVGARPNWEYIRVDVLLPNHPKLDGLNYPAKWTLLELWCHCGQYLTDGFVRDAMWRRFGTANARRLLVEKGLAIRVDGGYQMHDYLHHQRSRAEVEELRDKRAKAGAMGGKAKANAVALAKQKPQQVLKQTASKPVAEAEAEAEAEHLVADVGIHPADRQHSRGVRYSKPARIL